MQRSTCSEEEWEMYANTFKQQRHLLLKRMESFCFGTKLRSKDEGSTFGDIQVVYPVPHEHDPDGKTIDGLELVIKSFREGGRGKDEAKAVKLLYDADFSAGAQYVVWLFRIDEPKEFTMWPLATTNLESCVPTSADSLRRWSQHILSGLNYLHGLGIVHRDIHPKNILITTSSIALICDFENSVQMGQKDKEWETEERVFGRLGFMAPEFYNNGLYSKKTDVYGFCATISFCLTAPLLDEEPNHALHLKALQETRLVKVLLSVLDTPYESRPSSKCMMSIWPHDAKEFQTRKLKK